MATKRKRGNAWQYIFKRAGVLEKPLALTFQSEEEGDEYARKLEALLDRGIVPSEHRPAPRVVTIEHLARQYTSEAHPSFKDRENLRSVVDTKGGTPWDAVDVDWVDGWVSDMKRVNRYAPATVRARVGALARCADWGVRKKLVTLPDNPFRSLPRGYSQYTEHDAALAGKRRVDVERDRRIDPGEEAAILAVIRGGVLKRRFRPYHIPHQQDVENLFLLALETAMRMREMYTLTNEQVDLAKRTVFLDKTKNGDKRAVPLSSVALSLLRQYVGRTGYLFPWLSEQKGNLKYTTNYLGKLFANIFAEAGCDDLHWHDTRHEATSRFFERTSLDYVAIAKITGHKNPKMLMRYANIRGSHLADSLW